MHLLQAAHRINETPQDEAAEKDQVENNASGFVFRVDPWTRLDRFLILGSTASFYQTTRELTLDNAKNLKDLIVEDGLRVVARIVEISEGNRAPKQDYGLFALAACSGWGDIDTRQAAHAAIPRVCRTGSTFLQFISYAEKFRGWGMGFKKAVAKWFTSKSPEHLAYQVIKYRMRHEWRQVDVLRLAHADHSPVLQWLAGKTGESLDGLPQIIRDYELVPHAENEARIELAKALPREALPTEWLQDPKIWETLLHNSMPLTAIIRSLVAMTGAGILNPGSDGAKRVVDSLNVEYIHKSRVHPVAILTALFQYKSGKSVRNGNVTKTWIPTPEIVEALDKAFYLAFDNVEPSGKRIFIGLDVSGSMGTPMPATPWLSSREACAAMAMLQVATEPEVQVYGFTATQGNTRWSVQAVLKHLPFAKGQRLDDVLRLTNNLPFGGTDCALPMIHALEKNIMVDTFVIYTDSETWAGDIHPFQALKKYRQRTGIPAKLVVVGTQASEFSIADPSDAGMLDCAGFSSDLPAVIADFSRASM